MDGALIFHVAPLQIFGRPPVFALQLLQPLFALTRHDKPANIAVTAAVPPWVSFALEPPRTLTRTEHSHDFLLSKYRTVTSLVLAGRVSIMYNNNYRSEEHTSELQS